MSSPFGLFGNPGVILHFVGVGGQPADQRFFDENGLEPGASRVDGGGHAGGTAADDHDVIMLHCFFSRAIVNLHME